MRYTSSQKLFNSRLKQKEKVQQQVQKQEPVQVLIKREEISTKQEKNLLFYIEQFGKLASILAAMVTFIGCIDLYFYYGLFNINIFDYIELSEAFLHFMDTLIAFILFLLFLSIPVFLSTLIITKINSKKSSSEIQEQDFNLEDFKKHRREKWLEDFQNERVKEFLKQKEGVIDLSVPKENYRETKHKNLIEPLVIGFFGYLSIKIAEQYEKNFFFSQFFNVSILFAMLPVFITIAFVLFLKKDFDDPTVKKYILPLLVFFVVIGFGVGRGVSKRSEVLKNPLTALEQINISDTALIHTNDKLIGKTRNFIFLYNTTTKTSSVVKADKVSEINFK